MRRVPAISPHPPKLFRRAHSAPSSTSSCTPALGRRSIVTKQKVLSATHLRRCELANLAVYLVIELAGYVNGACVVIGGGE
jgi:hypothetical protein